MAFFASRGLPILVKFGLNITDCFALQVHCGPHPFRELSHRGRRLAEGEVSGFQIS